MAVEVDELISVACMGCNKQLFKFSRNLLQKKEVHLECPECGEVTRVCIEFDCIVIFSKNPG